MFIWGDLRTRNISWHKRKEATAMASQGQIIKGSVCRYPGGRRQKRTSATGGRMQRGVRRAVREGLLPSGEVRTSSVQTQKSTGSSGPASQSRAKRTQSRIWKRSSHRHVQSSTTYDSPEPEAARPRQRTQENTAATFPDCQAAFKTTVCHMLLQHG